MAKMNEMSARALTMEELENVNGGGIPRGGKMVVCIPRSGRLTVRV